MRDESANERKARSLRARRARVKEENTSGPRCLSCLKHPKLQHDLHCETCFLKRAAGRILGSPKKWKLLREVCHRDRFRCQYTGRPLDYGLSLSFDHRVPRSRGGSSTLENVCLAHTDVNRAKGDMSSRSFLLMCMQVLQHHIEQPNEHRAALRRPPRHDPAEVHQEP